MGPVPVLVPGGRRVRVGHDRGDHAEADPDCHAEVREPAGDAPVEDGHGDVSPVGAIAGPSRPCRCAWTARTRWRAPLDSRVPSDRPSARTRRVASPRSVSPPVRPGCALAGNAVWSERRTPSARMTCRSRTTTPPAACTAACRWLGVTLASNCTMASRTNERSARGRLATSAALERRHRRRTEFGLALHQPLPFSLLNGTIPTSDPSPSARPDSAASIASRARRSGRSPRTPHRRRSRLTDAAVWRCRWSLTPSSLVTVGSRDAIGALRSASDAKLCLAGQACSVSVLTPSPRAHRLRRRTAKVQRTGDRESPDAPPRQCQRMDACNASRRRSRVSRSRVLTKREASRPGRLRRPPEDSPATAPGIAELMSRFRRTRD